jgi:hypothetical protein
LCLVVSDNEIAENIHVGYFLQFIPIVLDQMADDVLDVLPLDEVEEFQTCRV